MSLDPKRQQKYLKELQNSSGSYIKVPYLKIPTGETKVRVLPGIDPGSTDKDFYCRASLHYGANPANLKIPVTCPKTTSQTAPCPVCEKIEELRRDGSEEAVAEATRMKPTSRYFMCVLPRTGEDAGKLMVYSAPYTVYNSILKLITDEEYGDITDPINGLDIKIDKSINVRATTYDVKCARISTALCTDPEDIAELLDKQFELWRFREAPSYEEIQQFMTGDLQRFTTGGLAVNAPESKAVEDEDVVEEDATPEVEVTPTPTPKPAPVPVADVVEEKASLIPEAQVPSTSVLPAAPKKRADLSAIRAAMAEKNKAKG